MVDAVDSKSTDSDIVRVRVSLGPPTILFSIIQSARINGLNVEKYITYLLQNINKKKLEELTPYSEDINNDFRIIKG